MGRKAKFCRGSTHNGFTVVETHAPSKDKNRRLGVVCATCGAGQVVWNTSLSGGKVNCAGCAQNYYLQSLVNNEQAPILAVYDSSAVIIMHGQLIPSDAKLLQFVDGRTALPYVPKALGGVPKPSTAYLCYMEVPAAYLDYYCPVGGREASPIIADLAYDFYMDNVDCPGVEIGRHTAASRDTWQRDGQMWAYLYWVNELTWPKHLLPRPAKVQQDEPMIRVLPLKRAAPVIQGLEEAEALLKTLKEADDAAFEAKRQAENAGHDTWQLETASIAASAAVKEQEMKIQRMRFPS